MFIIAYAISTLFMAVYSISMDTLLACFIIDETNQKAKGGKAPLYAPEELAELIDRDWFWNRILFLLNWINIDSIYLSNFIIFIYFNIF